VPQARRFARELLASWELDECEWVLLQLLSELATNAVIHARTAYTVSITDDGARTRLSVRDASPRTVVPRQYGADSTTGRGLQLVAQMSRAWGVEEHPDGKTVWVEIDPSPAQDVAEADVDELLNAFADGDGIVPAAPRGQRNDARLHLSAYGTWHERAA